MLLHQPLQLQAGSAGMAGRELLGLMPPRQRRMLTMTAPWWMCATWTLSRGGSCMCG